MVFKAVELYKITLEEKQVVVHSFEEHQYLSIAFGKSELTKNRLSS